MEIQTLASPHFFPRQLHNLDLEPTAETDPQPTELQTPLSSSSASAAAAATKLQKVYRGYRTRHRLADSAVIAEEFWWRALDFARLNHSTISFFNFFKPETAVSRWSRISLNASKVGQGLSKDSKALTLAFQHWIEASISAYSGHYKPSEENLNNFLNFLREKGVDLSDVEVPCSSNEDYYDDSTQDRVEKETEATTFPKPPQLEMPMEMENQAAEPSESSEAEAGAEVCEAKGIYKRTLSGGLQSPRADVPRKSIMERIKSKREACSYQLGNQLSLKWCTGAGPRIGCVADYPVELRTQALEYVNLSPRVPPTPNSHRLLASCLPPTYAAAAADDEKK